MPDNTNPASSSNIAWSFIFNTAGGLLLVQPRTGQWSAPLTPANDNPPLAAYRQSVQLSGDDLEPCGTLPLEKINGKACYGYVFMVPGLAENAQSGARWFSAEEFAGLKSVLPNRDSFQRAAMVLENPKVDFVLARDRPNVLSDDELLETVSWLHIMGMLDSDVYTSVKKELDQRHIEDPTPSDNEHVDEAPKGTRPANLQDSSPLAKDLLENIVVPAWGAQVTQSLDQQPDLALLHKNETIVCPYCQAELDSKAYGWLRCGWCKNIFFMDDSPDGPVAHRQDEAESEPDGTAPMTIVLAPGASELKKAWLEKAALDEAHKGVMIALAIPLPAAKELAKTVSHLKGVKPVSPEQMHVTLSYFGKMNGVDFPREVLERITQNFAEDHAPLYGEIGGLGRFHGDGKEGALVGLFDCKDLVPLRNDLLQALDAHNILPDEAHAFTAHVTLGYVPSDTTILAPVKKIPLTVTKMVSAWGSQGWKTYPLNSHKIQMSADKFMVPPPEQGTFHFAFQHHYRGTAVHLDLRLEENGKLLGWTMVELAAPLQKPVTSLDEARVQDANPANWRMNWQTGILRNQKLVNGETRRGELRAAAKTKEVPIEWLRVQGVTTKPMPDEPAPKGANQTASSVITLLDKGVFEYGAQADLFHEYFLEGSKVKGRFLFRLLRGAGLEKADHPYFVIPVGKTVAEASDPYVWVLMQPDDEKPYVLSDDAVKKNWLPLNGYSALPRVLRDKVPPSMQYWRMDGAVAQAARKDLADHYEEFMGPGMRTAEEGGIEKPQDVVKMVTALPEGAMLQGVRSLPTAVPIEKTAHDASYTIQLPPIHITLPKQDAPVVQVTNNLPAQPIPEQHFHFAMPLEKRAEAPAAPVIHVHEREIPPAQIHITNQVATPNVKVTNEVTPTPIEITVPPAAVTVNAPEPRMERLDVERDPDGLIKSAVRTFMGKDETP